MGDADRIYIRTYPESEEATLYATHYQRDDEPAGCLSVLLVPLATLGCLLVGGVL